MLEDERSAPVSNAGTRANALPSRVFFPTVSSGFKTAGCLSSILVMHVRVEGSKAWPMWMAGQLRTVNLREAILLVIRRLGKHHAVAAPQTSYDRFAPRGIIVKVVARRDLYRSLRE